MIESLKDEIKLTKRHIKILKLVRKEQPIGILKISKKSGVANHEARYSLRVLENSDLIEPSKKGAKITEKGNKFLENIESEVDRLIDSVKRLKNA